MKRRDVLSVLLGIPSFLRGAGSRLLSAPRELSRGTSASQGTTAAWPVEERFTVDYAGFLRRHDLNYSRPIDNPREGLVMGNGDLGVLAWQEQGTIRFNLSKNDVWDGRFPWESLPHKEPTQAEFIQEVKNLSAGTRLSTSKRAPKTAYPFPETNLVLPIEQAHHRANAPPYPCPKPCGAILFSLASGEEEIRVTQSLSLYTASLEFHLENSSSKARLLCFVPAMKNIFVLSIFNEGVTPLEFSCDLHRWHDSADSTMSAPNFGQNGTTAWIRHRLPPDPTYPEGFEYVVMTRVEGASSSFAARDDRIRVKISLPAGGSAIVSSAVATSADRPEPFEESRRLLEENGKEGFKVVHARHKSWWHGYWEKSFVQLDNKFAERLWYVQNYLLACCSQPGKVAPGFYGNWVYMDKPFWHGYYTLNYNFQSIYWGAFSSNHLDQIEPYYSAILAAVPSMRRTARQVYGCRGVKYPHNLFPRSMEENFDMGSPWDRTMGLSAWVAQGFWWHFVYTQDTEFLRTRAYPFLKECATFYVDFLKKGSDGRYQVFPTVSAEHHGITVDFFLNRNDCISVATIKFLFRAVIKGAEILGYSEDEGPRWKEILANMAEYPQAPTQAGPVFVDVENAPPDMRYNYPVPLAMIFPGEDPDVMESPALRSMAERTALRMITTTEDSFVTLPVAKLRLGLYSLDEFEKDFGHQFLPNSMWIGGCGARPLCVCGPSTDGIGTSLVINETLLQSHDGAIRVFPYSGRLLGASQRSAAFRNLRAQGAFLVSSEFFEGRVRYVVLESLAGSRCVMINPWIGVRPRLRRLSKEMGTVRYLLSGSQISFSTKRGEKYVLDLRENGWESIMLRTMGEGA
jgi:hypothetical protein